MENGDQKPLHLNEAGSRAKTTLASRGQRDVALREAVDATRSRFSVLTYATSNPIRARSRGAIPVEIMFKGGARIQKSLDALRGKLIAEGEDMTNISFCTSDSGSYRTEHILDYLERHLPEYTTERGWRILMLDVYAAHADVRVAIIC